MGKERPQIIVDNHRELPAVIKVVGVGGGGGNAVENMYKTGIKDVFFTLCNTDRQAMQNTLIPQTLVLGPGLGAGGVPEKGRQLAEDSVKDIKTLFEGVDMTFITAGMGGGTGTGASPVVARVAKEMGVLTVGIVTLPFYFEGDIKIQQAIDGAKELAKNVDALLVICNENLQKVYPDLGLWNAFAKADDILTIAAKSIAEVITVKGYINVDFNDVKSVLQDGGVAVMSTGYGEGHNRITKALDDALHSPLMASSNIHKAKKILINLYMSRQDSDEQVVVKELRQLNDFAKKFKDAGVAVKTITGMTQDDTLGNKVKITILASDFVDGGSLDDIGALYEEEKEYVVFTAAQLDDNAVLEMVDRSPTYKRSSDFLDQLANIAIAEPVAETPVIRADGAIQFGD